MNTKDYIKLSLMELGLTEGESRVYLALAKNPGVQVSCLKLKTGYSNAGVYKILIGLLDKGLVSVDEAAYPLKYFAMPLNKIADKVFNKGRKLGRLAERLKNLDRLSQMPGEISEVYEDEHFTDYYLNIPYEIEDGFIWCVGSFGSVKDFLGREVENEFIKMRLKKGINCDALIFDDDAYSRKFGSTNRFERRETRFIPTNNYPMEFTYLFGDNTVTFYKDYDDKVKILKTASRELAKAKLMQYQMLWKSVNER